MLLVHLLIGLVVVAEELDEQTISDRPTGVSSPASTSAATKSTVCVKRKRTSKTKQPTKKKSN